MKILIIEDEIKISNLVKRGLQMEHYEVETAFDGKTGFELAQEKEFDLIIIDFMLPRMTGLEVTKSLRQKKIQTPIIMMTARDMAEDRAKGLEAGVDAYLVKPFSFSQLLEVSTRLTEKK